jgi:hypothetical protein
MKVYTTKRGDTPSLIALAIYKDAARWEDIYLWNAEILPEIHSQSISIDPGLTLTFPDVEGESLSPVAPSTTPAPYISSSWLMKNKNILMYTGIAIAGLVIFAAMRRK